MHGPRSQATTRSTAAAPVTSSTSSTLATLSVNFKFAPFAHPETSTRTRDQRSESDLEVLLASLLSDALRPAIILSRYPKSQIDINVQVLSDMVPTYTPHQRSSHLERILALNCLSAAITCASVALVNAGIECFDITTSAVVSADADHHLITDPRGQSPSPSLTMVIAYMSERSQLNFVWMEETGQGSKSDLGSTVEDQLLESAIKAASETRLVVDHALTQ